MGDDWLERKLKEIASIDLSFGNSNPNTSTSNTSTEETPPAAVLSVSTERKRRRRPTNVIVQPTQQSTTTADYVQEGISLSTEQCAVIDKIKNSTDNFFITGKAGTGKSLVLRYLLDHSSGNIAVVAPTGIAAINVGGQTLHSFFGLSTRLQDSSNPDAVFNGLTGDRLEVLSRLQTLIIDEISMVRVDVMDMVDAKLRAAKKNSIPFGGCQIICFGDLYQLPPVVKEEEVQKYLMDVYHTIFFFGAPAVSIAPFTVVELQEVHRQADGAFKDLLNEIREGKNSYEVIHAFDQRCLEPDDEENCPTLTPTKKAANTVNSKELEKINLPSFYYHALHEGNIEKEDMPNDEILELKVGAQVMMIKNNRPNWVNGNIGRITDLTEDSITVRVNGREFSIDKETWIKYRYQYNPEKKKIEHAEVGRYIQYPIQLAYAITIHKSQGQTYDAVRIDYSQQGAFAAGQTYVALSRCKSFDHLYLAKPMQPNDIKVNKEIVAYLHGEYEPKPVDREKYKIPEKPEDKKPILKWTDDNRIQAKVFNAPKKITGTRLAGILNMDQYNTPFKIWCAIMRVYEEPFKETKFTKAGKTIEPIQFEFAKKKLAKPGRTFLSPADKYGDDAANKMGYDFFQLQDMFGGMWDYVMYEHGKIKAVLEMKTTSEKKHQQWESNYPQDKIVQAALYAWLLGIEDIYMVTSYIQPWQYEEPDLYKCTDANTTIRHIKISDYYKNFNQDIIQQAKKWWGDHIDTGLSPQYDKEKDNDILEEIIKKELKSEDDYEYEQLMKEESEYYMNFNTSYFYDN